MKKFLSHISTTVTIWDGTINTELVIVSGNEYDLPADNKFVEGLIAQGKLTPVKEEKTKTDK